MKRKDIKGRKRMKGGKENDQEITTKDEGTKKKKKFS